MQLLRVICPKVLHPRAACGMGRVYRTRLLTQLWERELGGGGSPESAKAHRSPRAAGLALLCADAHRRAGWTGELDEGLNSSRLLICGKSPADGSEHAKKIIQSICPRCWQAGTQCLPKSIPGPMLQCRDLSHTSQNGLRF